MPEHTPARQEPAEQSARAIPEHAGLAAAPRRGMKLVIRHRRRVELRRFPRDDDDGRALRHEPRASECTRASPVTSTTRPSNVARRRVASHSLPSAISPTPTRSDVTAAERWCLRDYALRMDTSDLLFLPDLFDHLPLGIIVLDRKGMIVVYNEQEARLAGRVRERVLGKEFFVEVAPCMNVRELGARFYAGVADCDVDASVEFSLSFPHNEGPRDVHVRMRGFQSGGNPYAMVSVEDTTFETSIQRMRERMQEFLVHDLKNPLSVILNSMSFVDDELIPHPANVDIKEALQDGITSARRLNAMLLDLLDITRLETDTMPLARVPTDLRELVTDCARAARAGGRLRKVTVDLDLPEDPVTASVDVSVLRRAIENLVDNAVRQAGRLRLGVESSAGTATILVEDDGPGIPEDVIGRIFDRYVQQIGSPGTGATNRGLGLTFVKLAARAHGGDIDVERGRTRGAVFRLRLPLQ